MIHFVLIWKVSNNKCCNIQTFHLTLLDFCLYFVIDSLKIGSALYMKFNFKISLHQQFLIFFTVIVAVKYLISNTMFVEHT